ncbi:MAG: hypothetical protein KDA89_21560, partial [Planctomycetaceae bacterium]|nr:hypothetical protein [Planctomycetaceae bacterium]
FVGASVPGGTKGLLVAAAIMMISVVGILSVGTLELFGGPPALPATRITNIAISPDGKNAFAARIRGVWDLWDLQTGSLRSRLQLDGASDAVFSRDGTGMLVFCGKEVRRVDLNDLRNTDPADYKVVDVPGTVVAHYDPPGGDSHWVLCDNGKLVLQEINRDSLEPGLARTLAAERAGRFAVSNDLSLVAMVERGQVKLFAGENAAPVGRPLAFSDLVGPGRDSGAVRDVAISADGTLMAVAAETAVAVVDLNSSKTVAVLFADKLKHPATIVHVRFQNASNDLAALTIYGGMLTATDDFKSEKLVDAVQKSGVLSDFDLSLTAHEMVYCYEDSRSFSVADPLQGKPGAELSE